jgi:peptidyl-prolyl cis-trans isomerase C
MTTETLRASALARVNGVALHTTDDKLSPDELRQRACAELLRQTAQAAGLLDASDAPSADGVISEAAANAIDALLEQNLNVPEPSEEACRRHYAAQESTHRTGERVRVRHILFAVTPGVDVVALRKRAEPIFLDVRCQDDHAADTFADAARKWSNCPSGEHGGDLGWLGSADCAPEFARELFGHIEICTSWRFWSANPASHSHSNRCAAPWPCRCANSLTSRRCASICNCSQGRP